MEPVEPPREVIISQSQWLALREHAAACAPQEACGILAGHSGRCVSVIPLTNALHSRTRYEVAPEALFQVFKTLQRNDWELLAIFHSHPCGEARPSATDIANAYYPHSAYLILAPVNGDWICRAYRIQGREAGEIPVHVR
jgi:proteasome lid subunit RPN8/RPN11